MGVIELYKGERDEFVGRLELNPILLDAVRAHVGDSALQADTVMRLHAPPEEAPFPGPPRLVNRTDGHGHCTISVTANGQSIYEAEHTVSGFLGPALGKMLSKLDPNETCWSFRIRVSAIDALVLRLRGRPTPAVRGAVEVDLGRRRHQPFTVTPMTAASAAEVDPVRLGLPAEGLARINVLVSPQMHAQLAAELPISRSMEEGGFLIGKVARAVGDAGQHLVQITHVTPAVSSGAGAIHFTFTGDSFLAAAEIIEARGQDEDLVGWYHSHLLGVDVEMGLSETDVHLHLGTFQQPWQVAVLINLSARERTLRCYGRAGEQLEEYPLWIGDERGGYRAARPHLGTA
jgi:proteasome lid subunit RPN8/RPN11